MSWDSYIENLTASGVVKRGAIVGSDGSTWATSQGFDPTGTNWVGYFTPGQDISGLQSGGLSMNNEKYFFVREERDSDGNIETIILRKGPGGAVIVKANTCYIVACFDEGYAQQPLSEATRLRVRSF